MRDENQAKTRNNWNLKWKKERAVRRQNGVGEGNGKIWDLKYKISKDLEIKLKKCNKQPPYPQSMHKEGQR